MIIEQGAGIGRWLQSTEYNSTVVPHTTAIPLNNQLFEDVGYVASFYKL